MTTPPEPINPTIIPEDEFERRYEPIPDSSGNMVLDHADVKGKPLEHVWTIVEGDNGNLYADPGFHVVNVVGYLFTVRPWESEFVLGEWDIRWREPEGPIDTDTFVTIMRDLINDGHDEVLDPHDMLDRMKAVLDRYDDDSTR